MIRQCTLRDVKLFTWHGRPCNNLPEPYSALVISLEGEDEADLTVDYVCGRPQDEYIRRMEKKKTARGERNVQDSFAFICQRESTVAAKAEVVSFLQGHSRRGQTVLCMWEEWPHTAELP
ncbi:hypothetical protein D918_08282 [Trichuris suis]|nr:hypothetical protein D918_08282 [Trichuris suis]